ncbi:hypothetical protein NS506_05882 [Nocardia seriolae]|uniref:Uncharacterized protein n=1 Tax=Nocardia seriolae TaxID=37332 RepID=A0ABC8B075_9NOCA|nr:hypothetical protein NS506_05882 [Nocardia seriolae]BEK89605.1 hypothetical protein NSERKGN1266_55560 [Nocardia seriolae]BEK94776.1 hypothetical protein NSER024013_26820 [Nocardia seriolae]GEM24736.1 hypothetical protein NS2_29750 [Nocardia seriolae NBRC 15557]
MGVGSAGISSYHTLGADAAGNEKNAPIAGTIAITGGIIFASAVTTLAVVGRRNAEDEEPDPDLPPIVDYIPESTPRFGT